jgi:deoxycytidine triphosphate deaminase
MDDDLATLKSSIIDRATALGSYVSDLRADSARSDEGFTRALEICAGYTQAFVAQLRRDWDESDARDDRLVLLSSSLGSFLRREWWIDQRFARGAQRDVPRALKTIARKEFRDHGLDGHEPVLTVGPPDSFETHQASLAEFLFEDIYIEFTDPEFGHLHDLRHDGAALSIFSAPYIEGTRVLWYPIALGHEIAHVRLDHGHGGHIRATLVKEWFRELGVEYSAAADEVAGTEESRVLARPTLERQMMDWVTEVICDLNAARRFGPAGVSAIAEFLATLEFQPGAYALDKNTHPPLWVRLDVLFRALERWGWSEGAALPGYASVWTKRASRPASPLSARVEHGAKRILEKSAVERLIDFVEDWGDAYTPTSTRERIQEVTEELLDGVPGTTHVGADPESGEVTIEDVVNATWAARQALNDNEAKRKTGYTGVLLDCDLDAHEKRVKLDSLASKAIDTLELKRLLGEGQSYGVIPVEGVDLGKSANGVSSQANGGVMSRRTIARRLQDKGEQRLIITPLTRNSVQDAAIDLCLGPDFIVFRHSGTEAFNPLGGDGQDLRTMQERVHMGWGEPFVLHPQELVLAATLEYIVLPDDVAAQVLTRSSYGRLGLLTATAVQVQPGSRGCITLELVNQGETPIRLAPGARVAQLMLWTVTAPSKAERGKYWFPVGPQFSKVSADADREALSKLAETANTPAARSASPITARFEGEEALAEQFYRTARAAGAVDQLPTNERRLGPGLVEAIVGVTLSIKILAMTILRWLQANQRGVVVREVDGDIVVRKDNDLPKGTIAIIGRDGVTLKQLKLPPDDESDVIDAIRKLAGPPDR